MKRTALLFLILTMLGCAHTIAISTNGRLSHEEVVARLKPLINEQVMFEYPLKWWAPKEERVSSTLTRIVYIGEMHPPQGLATAPSAEVLSISIDTSTRDEVRLAVTAELRGSRRYKTEEWASSRLSAIERRANQALEATPDSAPLNSSSPGGAHQLHR